MANIDTLLPTLYAKTFFVLGVQLFITWAGAILAMKAARLSVRLGCDWFVVSKNAAGKDDLDFGAPASLYLFWGSIAGFIAGFVALMVFGGGDLKMSMILFGFWSVMTGIMMAMCLLAVDENLGAKVLGITICVTLVTALIGVYSGIDFNFMGQFLYWGLIALVAALIAGMFISLPGGIRLTAGAGILLFTGWLVFDFFRLREAVEAGVNDWPAAIDLAIDIYLDIINLFLDLLEWMSGE